MTTIQEIKETEKAFLTCAEIAPVIGSDAHALRIEARKENCRLGFQVLLIGNRVKIPVAGFIAWYEGKMPMRRSGLPEKAEAEQLRQEARAAEGVNVRRTAEGRMSK